MEKAKKNGKELETLVAEAIERVVGGARAMPTVVEAHIRDGMGRNWGVSARAPTPMHRKAIDSVRDAFDLG